MKKHLTIKLYNDIISRLPKKSGTHRAGKFWRRKIDNCIVTITKVIEKVQKGNNKTKVDTRKPDERKATRKTTKSFVEEFFVF